MFQIPNRLADSVGLLRRDLRLEKLCCYVGIYAKQIVFGCGRV